MDAEKARAALIEDNSDWIMPDDDFACEEYLISAGCYRVQNHTGPSKQKFFSLQDTSGIPKTNNTIVYEVKGSNNIKGIFNMRESDSNEE